MYDSEVMCRQKVDNPWYIYRDFTVLIVIVIIIFLFLPQIIVIVIVIKLKKKQLQQTITLYNVTKITSQ